MSLNSSAEIAAFRAWIRRLVDEREARDQVDSPLFHYSSAFGITKVIENQVMWFSDFRHLNDPQELSYGLAMAHSVADEAYGVVGSDGRMFLDSLLDALDPDNIMNSDNDPDKLEFFVGSFSRNPDELGQWRAYADNGRGMALGLAPECFTTAAPSSKLDEMTIVSSVVYGEETAKSRHRTAINQALRIIERFPLGSFGANRGEGLSFYEAIVRELLAGVILLNCITSKHEAYQQEAEVRLVVMSPRVQVFPFMDTRVRGSEIVPFVSYPLPLREKRGLISRIVLGPASSADAERTLLTFLERQQVFPPPEIVRSRIPYRPTT